MPRPVAAEDEAVLDETLPSLEARADEGVVVVVVVEEEEEGG
jgi:hypothetical protein